MTYVNQLGYPGLRASIASVEVQPWWGLIEHQKFVQGPLDSTTVDAGSSPTTQVRAGLVLGRITSTGAYVHYSASATDGSQTACAVLCDPVAMLDASGTAESKLGPRIMVAGNLKAGNLIGLDGTARRQLAQHFLFDDELDGRGFLGVGPRREITKTTDYTVTTADNGALFTSTASGALVFTLPAVAKGLVFEFLNLVNQNMTITATAAVIVALNSAGSTNVAFSTSSQKIGARIRLEANAAGDKWLATIANGATASLS